MVIPYALIVALTAAASLPPSLVGTWQSADGRVVARIAPCSADAAALCANTLIENAGATAAGRLVMTGLKPSQQSVWKGKYLLDGSALPATLRLVGADLVEIKVCRWFLCQSDRYRRVDAR